MARCRDGGPVFVTIAPAKILLLGRLAAGRSALAAGRIQSLARVAELVDAADLKSAGLIGRAGSSPALGTN